jgi:diphthamide biosynthesis protein 7
MEALPNRGNPQTCVLSFTFHHTSSIICPLDLQLKMEENGTEISSIHSLRLELPPCAVEFSPANPEYFVVGTYDLQREEPDQVETEATEETGNDDLSSAGQKRTQNRNGSLMVFRVEDNTM